MSVFKEFKDFALKSSLIDIAIGIIIGAAFGKIVTSLVGDIIMPPLGLLIGGVNFNEIVIPLRDAHIDPTTGRAVAAVAIKIGSFLQTLFDFFIIAFSIFLILKAMVKISKRKDLAITPNENKPPTKEEALLTEIRDLLKKGQEK